MYQEIRPTCVTVISWAWIIIGSLMMLGAIGGVAVLLLDELHKNHQEVPFDVPVFLMICVIQFGLGALGFVAGINFLKLKAWSRTTLEVLTWLFLIFLVGFMFFFMFNWIAMTTRGPSPLGFAIMGGVTGVLVSAFYGVPLGIMLKYLRGSKIKNAIGQPTSEISGEAQD